jgi:hypothetical protein
MKAACAVAMFLALVAVPGCDSVSGSPGRGDSPPGGPGPGSAGPDCCVSDSMVPDSMVPDSMVPDSPGPDAIILAIRMQTGIALDTSLASQLDRLLVLARTADPTTLSAIHARPDASLTSMLVRATGRVAAAYAQGELRTEVTALDTLLASFQFASVRLLVSPDFFVLKFQQPLRTIALAAAIKSLEIAEILDAEPDGIVGDGDNIVAARVEGGWVITFDHGEGDCPAGCISHIKTDVLVDDGGGVHLLGRH